VTAVLAVVLAVLIIRDMGASRVRGVGADVGAAAGGGAGVVYLLHFSRPYGPGGGANGRGTARHYIGWAADLEARLAAHERGQGARLLAVIKAAGIGFELVRTWPGSRVRERQIKRQGGASRCCPLCGVKPRGGSK